MDTQGFTPDASPISNFGPHGQVRVRFNRTQPASTGHADVVAYFVDSIGLTCIAVDARTGPQVTLHGIRLIGRRPSELAKAIAAHLANTGKRITITEDGEISHSDWGMYPRPQRVGDVLLTRAVFGRPNSWAYTTFDCIPGDEWKGLPVIGVPSCRFL